MVGNLSNDYLGVLIIPIAVFVISFVIVFILLGSQNDKSEFLKNKTSKNFGDSSYRFVYQFIFLVSLWATMSLFVPLALYFGKSQTNLNLLSHLSNLLKIGSGPFLIVVACIFFKRKGQFEWMNKNIE